MPVETWASFFYLPTNYTNCTNGAGCAVQLPVASCQLSVAAQVAGMRVVVVEIRTALQLFLFPRMNTDVHGWGMYGRLPKRRCCHPLRKLHRWVFYSMVARRSDLTSFLPNRPVITRSLPGKTRVSPRHHPVGR
jgi:hypothetical protein